MTDQDDPLVRFLKETLPEGVDLRFYDKQAVGEWLKRNPDATPEEVQQLLMAPDHNLGEIVGGEEE
jgi:hypothetical protein